MKWSFIKCHRIENMLLLRTYIIIFVTICLIVFCAPPLPLRPAKQLALSEDKSEPPPVPLRKPLHMPMNMTVVQCLKKIKESLMKCFSRTITWVCVLKKILQQNPQILVDMDAHLEVNGRMTIVEMSLICIQNKSSHNITVYSRAINTFRMGPPIPPRCPIEVNSGTPPPLPPRPTKFPPVMLNRCMEAIQQHLSVDCGFTSYTLSSASELNVTESTVRLTLTVSVAIGSTNKQHVIIFTCAFDAAKVVASVLKRLVKSY